MCFLFCFFFPSADIFVFLLSTRAGGLGINLTAADTVRPAQVYYVWDQMPPFYLFHCFFFFFSFFTKRTELCFYRFLFSLSFPSPCIRTSFWRFWHKAYRNAFKARGFEHASEGRSCEERGKEEMRFTLFAFFGAIKIPRPLSNACQATDDFYQDTIYVGIYLLPFPPGYILW